jgi:hypothetical protein
MFVAGDLREDLLSGRIFPPADERGLGMGHFWRRKFYKKTLAVVWGLGIVSPFFRLRRGRVVSKKVQIFC